MDRGPGFARRRNEEQLNRFAHHFARRHVDERAVGEKCGVQRGESVAVRLCVAPEVFFQKSRIRRQRSGEAINSDTVR